MTEQKFNTKKRLQKFKKQFVIGAGILFVSILILAFISQPNDTPPPPKAEVVNTFNAVKPLTPSPAEIMSQHLDEYSQNQKKINDQYAQKISELESENAMYKKTAVDNETNVALINQRLESLNTMKANPNVAGQNTIKKNIKIISEDEIDDSPVAPIPANNSTDIGHQDSSVTETRNPDKVVSTYIPSNSFVKGILIGALSANTGGNASGEPTPVLIRLTNLAQLPNEFRSNIKSCMVGGSGWGDLSTERVKIRLTTLSCVLKSSGKAIDIPVTGYISGEDAKADIKGMVVTHSGTIAAKAALAGFIQGVGQIGQSMGQTQTITPLGGVTTTISPNQALMSGAGSGVAQAGSTLSQYYMNMLTQISPAIEVSAGRHVTVIFTAGIELKLPINGEAQNNADPLPIN